MKDKGDSNNIILIWLKRLFSAQTISILIALFGAFFTYKTFYRNEPSQLSIILPEMTDKVDKKDGFVIFNTYDVRDITHFYCLKITDIPLIQLDYRDGIQIGTPTPFPILLNDTKKTIHSFDCSISTWWDSSLSDLYDTEWCVVSDDLNVIRQNNQSVVLKYTPDHLTPHTRISLPFEYTLYLSDDKTNLTKFNYVVTYEGVPQAINFHYTLRTYIEDPVNDQLLGIRIRDFLDKDVYTDWIGNDRMPNEKKALIINDKYYGILRNFKNHDEFLKFQYKTLDDFIIEKPQPIK